MIMPGDEATAQRIDDMYESLRTKGWANGDSIIKVLTGLAKSGYFNKDQR